MNWLKYVILVTCAIVFCFSNAFGQIKTDWIDGEKKKREPVDHESKPLQLLIEISVGTSKVTANRLGDTLSYWDFSYEDDDMFYGVSMGVNYRLVRMGEKGTSQIEISVFGSAGVNTLEFTGHTYRLLCTVGPELGLRIPVSSSLVFRPFASFGPGLSILDSGWENDNLNFVWIPRVGLELQFADSPFSLVLGGKMILRGDTEPEFGSDNNTEYSAKDKLGFLGFRIKI